jgi:hypothetical protein
MVRLLNPKTARAFYDWMMGFWAFASLIVGDVNLDRFQRWLWGTVRKPWLPEIGVIRGPSNGRRYRKTERLSHISAFVAGSTAT